MNRYLFILVSLLLGACTSNAPSDAPPTQNSIVVVDGPSTAATLTAQYLNTVGNCGSDSEPAFLCSGVMIRATIYSEHYLAWNPSPNATRKGAVSFSYLRKDSNFEHFVYDSPTSNGFIFFPAKAAPAGKLHIQVLCHFPNDGWSDDRWADRNGCGSYPGMAGSGPSCVELGVATGAQWGAKYPPGTSGKSICSFDVRSERGPSAAPAFNAALQAKSLNPWYFNDQNELLLKVWPTDRGRYLPMQAFFYAKPGGLADARKNKDWFIRRAGINLPIIKVTLPTTANGIAKFEYFAADQ